VELVQRLFSHYSFIDIFITALTMKKCRIIKELSALIFICSVSFCSCNDRKDQDGTQPIKDVAEFKVDLNKVVSADFVGFGAQYNNNLYTTLSASVDGVAPENVNNLEDKVKKLGSQHVRIFFDCKSWEGYPKYNIEFMPSFIKTVQLAQASGATINITYWHGAYDDLYEESGTWPMSRQMNDFANVIEHLIVDLGLTAVQIITIQK